MPEVEGPPSPARPCRSAADLAANLATVRARLDAAAVRVGRDPAEVRLLPVSKTVHDVRIDWAAAAGVTLVGENKAQEAQTKAERFAGLGMGWAMIGHLQTNKVKLVAGSARELHSLDSAKLAVALDRRLQELGTSLDVFLQVNSSGEPNKFGVEPDEVVDLARAVSACDSLRIRGLMTLARFSAEPEVVRACFVRMRNLRDRLQQTLPEPERFAELSMGMSGDAELAVEEGATTVRVGEAIFGPRNTGPEDYWPGETAAPDRTV